MVNKTHPQPSAATGAAIASPLMPPPTSIPPVGLTGNSDTARPWPAAQLSRPNEISPFDQNGQFEVLLKQFDHYASFGCCAPQHARDDIHFDHLNDPDCGTYPESGLPMDYEFRMRQAFELQTRLSLDASAHFSLVTGELPSEGSNEFFGTLPEQLRTSSMQAQLLNSKKKRDALINLQGVLLSQLRMHAELSGALFERLRPEVPADASTTELSPDCLQLMHKARIELPEKMNPLGLYKVLAKRLQTQERELFAVNLELLMDDLHVARMEFYLKVGQHLKGQAQTILAAYDESATDNAPLLDEDDELYEHLQEVVDEPIYTLWPAPMQPDVSDFMSRPVAF